MAEKIKRINLQRDHKNHLYYISGEGHVVSRHKKTGEVKVLHENACVRDNEHLFFIDKDGDVCRSPRASRKKAE